MSLPEGFLLRERWGIGERANRGGGENRGGARLQNRRTGFAWRLSFRLANGVSTSSDVPSRHPTRATAPTTLSDPHQQCSQVISATSDKSARLSALPTVG